jgi:hypothetical protein
VLVSPWLDVTPAGDTETTLHDADPNQLYEKHGVKAAAAFADLSDQKNPYASPAPWHETLRRGLAMLNPSSEHARDRRPKYSSESVREV